MFAVIYLNRVRIIIILKFMSEVCSFCTASSYSWYLVSKLGWEQSGIKSSIPLSKGCGSWMARLFWKRESYRNLDLIQVLDLSSLSLSGCKFYQIKAQENFFSKYPEAKIDVVFISLQICVCLNFEPWNSLLSLRLHRIIRWFILFY